MLATFKETSELLKCNRATLYRLKKEGRLDGYITEVGGVLYLELDDHAREPKLSTYLQTVIQWKGQQPCIDFSSKRYFIEQGEKAKLTKKLTKKKKTKKIN